MAGMDFSPINVVIAATGGILLFAAKDNRSPINIVKAALGLEEVKHLDGDKKPNDNPVTPNNSNSAPTPDGKGRVGSDLLEGDVQKKRRELNDKVAKGGALTAEEHKWLLANPGPGIQGAYYNRPYAVPYPGSVSV